MNWYDNVETEEQRIAKGMLKKYLRTHSIVKDTKTEKEAIDALVKWIKTWRKEEGE